MRLSPKVVVDEADVKAWCPTLHLVRKLVSLMLFHRNVEIRWNDLFFDFDATHPIKIVLTGLSLRKNDADGCFRQLP